MLTIELITIKHINSPSVCGPAVSSSLRPLSVVSRFTALTQPTARGSVAVCVCLCLCAFAPNQPDCRDDDDDDDFPSIPVKVHSAKCPQTHETERHSLFMCPMREAHTHIHNSHTYITSYRNKETINLVFQFPPGARPNSTRHAAKPLRAACLPFVTTITNSWLALSLRGADTPSNGMSF